MDFGDGDHLNGRLWLCMTVWLQAEVRECGLGCVLRCKQALSMTHSADEAAYAACGAVLLFKC